MTTQGQLQPAAHARAADGRDDGFPGVSTEADLRVAAGFVGSPGRAGRPDIRPAGERARAAGQHHGLHVRIGFGAGQPLHDVVPQIETQPVDGRVVHRDHGDRAAQFVDCGAHAVSLVSTVTTIIPPGAIFDSARGPSCRYFPDMTVGSYPTPTIRFPLMDTIAVVP